MPKKLQTILIVLIIAMIALIALANIYVVADENKSRSEYYFTTDKTKEEYQDVEGYSLFESANNDLSFLYPENWTVEADDEGEVYLYNPDGYGEIYCVGMTEEMSGLSADDYDGSYFNPILDSQMTLNGSEYYGDNIEMCLDVNGYDTFMWYNNMYPIDDEDDRTYDLEYTSLTGDEEAIFIGVYCADEDTLRVMTGSLEY